MQAAGISQRKPDIQCMTWRFEGALQAVCVLWGAGPHSLREDGGEVPSAPTPLCPHPSLLLSLEHSLNLKSLCPILTSDLGILAKI